MPRKLLLLTLSAILASEAASFSNYKEMRRAAAPPLRQRMKPTEWRPRRSVLPAHFGTFLDPISAAHSQLQDLNPEVKAEVMTDVSHVALDFTAFLTPSRLHILSFAIFGRICILYNDCCLLPGHGVPPEELAVQSLLLAKNLSDLVQAVIEHRSMVE